ncbi:PspA/IM30 family protein [Arthrobacter castelli]|uniref:PspA/IM30 family protein n=1 Tax=Arthrobacter castelli TaxID=271431 RepID=UPI00040B684A|nr:PspA/IM30 family protein [Arthrobacter castelli]
MSIRSRISRLIRVKRAPDQPSGMQTVEDAHYRQLEAYEKARRSTADLAATHRKLEVLCQQATSEVEDLKRQAERSVAAGDDDAARRALRDSLAARKRLDHLTSQRSDAANQLGQLQDQLDRIASRVADQQLHYHHLHARHGVTEATSSMQQAVTASDQAAFEAADAAHTAQREDKHRHHTAAARDEISGPAGSAHTSGSARFDAAFEELETSPDVESQLAKLKNNEEPPQFSDDSSRGQ